MTTPCEGARRRCNDTTPRRVRRDARNGAGTRAPRPLSGCHVALGGTSLAYVARHASRSIAPSRPRNSTRRARARAGVDRHGRRVRRARRVVTGRRQHRLHDLRTRGRTELRRRCRRRHARARWRWNDPPRPHRGESTGDDVFRGDEPRDRRRERVFERDPDQLRDGRGDHRLGRRRPHGRAGGRRPRHGRRSRRNQSVDRRQRR